MLCLIAFVERRCLCFCATEFTSRAGFTTFEEMRKPVFLGVRAFVYCACDRRTVVAGRARTALYED